MAIPLLVILVISFIQLNALKLPQWEPQRPGVHHQHVHLSGPKCHAMRDLDLAKLDGSWSAAFTRFNGFQCLRIDLLHKSATNTSQVNIWNANEKRDSYLLYQNYPRMKGFLERKLQLKDEGLKSYPWYVVDTDYRTYLAIYHVVNSHRKDGQCHASIVENLVLFNDADYWAIYTRKPNQTLPDNAVSVSMEKLASVGAKGDPLIYPVNQNNCTSNDDSEPAPDGLLNAIARSGGDNR